MCIHIICKNLGEKGQRVCKSKHTYDIDNYHVESKNEFVIFCV